MRHQSIPACGSNASATLSLSVQHSRACSHRRNSPRAFAGEVEMGRDRQVLLLRRSHWWPLDDLSIAI